MNDFEREIQKQVQSLTKGRLSDFTPSLQIGVLVKGKVAAKVKLGEPRTYFDLASLTKILFTVSTLMRLVDYGRLHLSDRIQKWWPEFPYKDVRVRDLLTHSAGFTAWSPLYRRLRKAGPATGAAGVTGAASRRQILRDMLFQLGRGPHKGPRRRSVYSDIDFLYLGFFLEKVAGGGKDLLSQWRDLKKRWPKNHLHFAPDNKRTFAKNAYAPTEKCPWRKTHLQGQVHDDNTFSLGGVSTHAGLFGTLDDLLMWGGMLRDGYFKAGGSKLASKKTIRAFTRRAVPASVGDWAMGFMMPSKKGSTAGSYFSPVSVGHTGFTGTSLWFDPKKDLVVVILANRVCPSRRRQKFKKLRPQLHDAIVKLLEA